METIVFLGLAAGPLLTIAALLLLLDFFLLFNTRPADEKRYALTFIGSLAACMFVIASYLILTAAFLTDSFSFREVYAYSSTGLSVLYKLGGPWIGSSGSLLFIAALLALGYAIYRVRSFEHGGEVRIAACQLLDLFLAFFILVTLPFTLAFVAALIGCYATLTRKNYAVLIAAVAAAGIGLAVAGIPTPYALANLGLPLLITATGVVGYRWLQTIRERKSLRVRGRTLLHLAIVLTLVGVFISSAAQNESDLIPVSQGSGIPAPGSVISIKNFTVFPGTGSVYYPPHAAVAPEYAGLETGVEIAEGGWRSGRIPPDVRLPELRNNLGTIDRSLHPHGISISPCTRPIPVIPRS